MGKPLSRPDCLRQNPRCLGKGDEEEAYIEDCYVPQRSIYDTMRINEQIDQGTKLCQPSRSTLGSGGEVRGEGSTLSSNGTIGADIGGVFVSRNADVPGGVKRLDERVIFDALKLTSDPQIMSPHVGVLGPGLPITPSSSSSGVVAAVVKRRHQSADKKDNPNRRSWKAFMPPSYPEFAERLEISSGEGTEKRSSGPGISLSQLHPAPPHLPPSTPTSSTPSLPPYTPSPLSSAPHTPPVCSSPSLTPTVSPVPPLLQHPFSRLKQVHHVLQKQYRQTHLAPSPSRERTPALSCNQSPDPPQQSPGADRQAERRVREHRRTTSSSSRAVVRKIPEEIAECVKTSDSERDSPLLDQDQGDNAPLIPPKPVFCPPTKARTWPRSITTGKRAHMGLKHNLPVLPPLPPLLGEDSNTDEESLYLLDPPSPFLKEEESVVYGGLPLSPCVSQEGGDEGLLAWGSQGAKLRERTASELKFEEDERRILEELEAEEQEVCWKMGREESWKKERDKAEEERAEREEREWEAVLKLENREIIDQSWHREILESEGWDLTGSSGHWPVLTPPTGFGGPGPPSGSPCPSSAAESDDLFLELERQCLEDEGEEGEEGEEMSVDPEPLDPYALPCLEEEEVEEETGTVWIDFEGTLPVDAVNSTDSEKTEPDFQKESQQTKEIKPFKLMRAQDCEKEHSVIDEECEVDYNENKLEFEEEASYPTDSALGQQLDSEFSGILTSQLHRTSVSDVTHSDCGEGKPGQTETEPDSGASSEPDDDDDDEDDGVVDSSSSHSPVNPYAQDLEQVEEAGAKDEEELGTEWDVFDQSEPSLDNSEGVLLDHSLESERETDSECRQDVQASCPDDPGPSEISPICHTKTPNFVDSSDEVSVLDVFGKDTDFSSSSEVTASTPKSDPCPRPVSPQRGQALPSTPPPSRSGSCGAGLESKDSDAFVISDSFVYLAVSAPPLYPADCPPSPLEDSIPPSPVSKPPEEEEGGEGAFLSPDSFVYMAAPERPQPGPSDVGSACEDTQELDLDLDSFSEGTQSGVDGVEFVLGSVTGDSDWESDGSALDFPPLDFRDHTWDSLEPGLLQNLFTPAETGQRTRSRSQDCEPQTGDTSALSESEDESTDILPFCDLETPAEVRLLVCSPWLSVRFQCFRDSALLFKWWVVT